MLNEQTLEFGQAKLKLKDGLRFSARESGRDVWYLVEDEATGKFFRIGLPQYTFLSLLNGRRTVNAALMRTSTILRKNAPDELEIANICKWSIESGLVETELSGSVARQDARQRDSAILRTVSWLNPIMLKVPLCNPDKWIERITTAIGWVVGLGGAILWLIVVSFGFFQLAGRFEQFTTHHIHSFSRYDLCWIGLTWILLKLVHEVAHGVVCKRFGGHVSSCGVLFLLFIPLPYVDVSSSWKFVNKWQRILTTAAGMLAEFFVAAIACCIWVWSPPGPWQYHAGNVIISATVSTLVFNINPLMRFDGYYILSDLLDIPNLSTNGRAYLKSFFERIYVGKKSNPVEETGWRLFAIRVYGVLAMIWFFVVVVGLSMGAWNLASGIGLLILLVSVGLWFAIPCFQFCKYLIFGTELNQPNRMQFVAMSSLTLAAISGFCLFCPSPSVISAPVVVDFDTHKTIRAETAGFIQQIHVANGDKVIKGDLLLTLENPKLVSDYNSILIDIQISELKIKNMLKFEEIASLKLERESLESTHNRKLELERMIDKMEIRALCDGLVMALDLESRLGTYLRPGDAILEIGDAMSKKAIALVKQDDFGWLKDSQETDVEVLLWSSETNELMNTKIRQIRPRASSELPHEAFGASNGGPLAVVPREQIESGKDSGDLKDSMILTEPRVSVELELAGKNSETYAGQMGQMIIRSRHQNMGQYLWNGISRFARNNSQTTHGL